MMQYNHIRKENAYEILKAFAKEYKKQNGESIPAEIIKEMKDKEGQTKEDLVEIDEKYPGIINEKSIDSILAEIRNRRRG